MLGCSENRVHDDDREDNDGTLNIAREHGYDRGGNENQHQQIRELTEKYLKDGFLFALREHVLSVSFQPFLRLFGAESVCRDAELFEHLGVCFLIPF